MLADPRMRCSQAKLENCYTTDVAQDSLEVQVAGTEGRTRIATSQHKNCAQRIWPEQVTTCSNLVGRFCWQESAMLHCNVKPCASAESAKNYEQVSRRCTSNRGFFDSSSLVPKNVLA